MYLLLKILVYFFFKRKNIVTFKIDFILLTNKQINETKIMFGLTFEKLHSIKRTLKYVRRRQRKQ